MSSEKTIATELSVGFGLLQLSPNTKLNEEDVRRRFSGTLSYSTYLRYLAFFAQSPTHYSLFWDIGLNLKRRYSQFRNANVQHVRWTGPRRQASTVSLPVDLSVLNTPISVKDDSNVVYNRSPFNLFEQLPRAHGDRKRAPNWYIDTAPEHYQSLYGYARTKWNPEYPADVTEYHSVTTKQARQAFRARIKAAESTDEFKEYQNRYVDFCQAVSKESAAIFNRHFTESRSQVGGSAVTEFLVRNLFRVGDVTYILCGLDTGNRYAIEIPGLSEWKQQWRVRNCIASEDTHMKREQPVVKLRLTFENIQTKQARKLYELEFRVEIRWSHGRFCGNPEAKLYKEFQWVNVPFVTKIYGESRYQKRNVIGDGGFAVVFEALDITANKIVAIKELSIKGQDVNEVERFTREVKIQSTLAHPNIVRVLDADLEANPPWCVMPLAQQNLAELIESTGGMTTAHALELFRQILSAVAYAHQMGYIHRDLKPENVLVFDENQVMVGDFGLGRQINPASPELRLTDSDESLGSWHYAAPEQLHSLTAASIRSDIYSLGKLLYFCLSSRVPFPNIDLDKVDGNYRPIIERCVRENPNERYQSVDEIMAAIYGSD